jgi:hypothetical protein
MVTLDIAKSFVALKDEQNGSIWSADNDKLAQAMVEFIEYSKQPQYRKSLPTDEVGIIDAITRIVNRYYSESSTYYRSISTFNEYERELMDNEIAELRAELSTLLFMMADVTFKDMAAKRSSILSRKEKAEARAYREAFENALTREYVVEDGDKIKRMKMSISVADSYARKVYKEDPVYVDEINDCERIDNEYWAVSKIFEQAKEVLNSMAKRIGKF